MKRNKFLGHLHVHTEYSALDGLSKIKELIERAKELGQEFITITDHGSSSGLFEAYSLSKEYDFPILLGEEFYFENECKELKTGHLILIAKNNTGLQNIFKLQKLAYDNIYYKPRINLKMLENYNEGLICTTACISNQIGQFILRDEPHLALGHIIELQKIFKDDLYIELQSSQNPDVIKVNKKLEELCRDYKLQQIVTTDVHYVEKDDYFVHEALLCIQQKGKMDSPKRWKFEYNDYWLKSEEEMLKYLEYMDEEFINSAFKNIEKIFNSIENITIEKGNYLPKFCQTKEEEDEMLRDMTFSNYMGRIKQRGECNKKFSADLEKELSVIAQMGYSGYFLIVQEYANWARKNGILVGDGRGSGAGSKVAYTIGITEVNPQKYDLLFERFLSPGREPDFDIDFSNIDAVYKHLQERYGEDNVARVGAFSRFTAKSALRKVMGIYGFSMSEISKVIALLPKKNTFNLEEAINESRELKCWLEEHENIYKTVYKIEGILSNMSTHAGGIIICEGLTSLLPIFTNAEDRTKMIVALDKKILEGLGHYKFDVLGLNSLTLMEDIVEYTGEIDWHNVDFEDKNVYKELCEGNVLGVFQLSDQKDKIIQQQPKCFEDLIAINALIRPGVCEWNDYLNARANSISSDLEYMNCTHGLIVYQDQYLQLAQTYAGWDIAYSDKHIRKNKDILNDTELKKKWMEDSNGNENVWNQICSVVAGGYGFNRAHSTSYARLSFQTAYMKTYYPKEFYAAYMTQNKEDSEILAEVVNELKQMGIKVLPPDINASTDKFIPVKEGILFALTAVKGVGGSVLWEIDRLKPIKSFEDFMERRVKKFVKKTAIIALIKAGAFDFCKQSKIEMLRQVDENERELQNWEYEKDAFDFYLSESPLDKYYIEPFETFRDGQNALTIVEITTVSEKYDKNGNLMAFVTGINNKSKINIIFFSSIWKKEKVKVGQIVLVKGKKDKNNLLANSMEVLESESRGAE